MYIYTESVLLSHLVLANNSGVGFAFSVIIHTFSICKHLPFLKKTHPCIKVKAKWYRNDDTNSRKLYKTIKYFYFNSYMFVSLAHGRNYLVLS